MNERLNRIGRSTVFLFVMSLFMSACASAAWQEDGTQVCTYASVQSNADIAPDLTGGAIIAWRDNRGGIYAQHMGRAGELLWTETGVPIVVGESWGPVIISDGTGGAIVSWDWGDIRAQRVDGAGNLLWAAGGVPVCTDPGWQGDPKNTPDGSGGAVITWVDKRADESGAIYAQRVDSSGNTRWTANGVAICGAVNAQRQPEITSDGSGGAIIIWADLRDNSSYLLYAQRINAAGDMLWTTDGVLVSAGWDHQYLPQLVPDGAGGAIITWMQEDGYSDNTHVYVQRVSASGAVLWGAVGVPICVGHRGTNPRLVSDSAGGAIITWFRIGDGTWWDIYAQRVDGSGNKLWGEDCVPICTADDQQYWPEIISDGSGGAIITWNDARGACEDVYTQRVDASGTIMWTPNGVGVCTDVFCGGMSPDPRLAQDGTGGTIIAWGYGTIYAERVESDGTLATVENPSPLVLDEDFEDGSLDGRITVETIGTYNSPPGIEDITDFGSTKAFGYGISTCGASCFDNYVTNLKITFAESIYVSTISFKEMELYGNWGSKGKIYIDGEAISWGDYNANEDFGREPMNDGNVDTAYRTHEVVIDSYAKTIELTVHDITTASEIFIDDLKIRGGHPLPVSPWTTSILFVMLALCALLALHRRGVRSAK